MLAHLLLVAALLCVLLAALTAVHLWRARRLAPEANWAPFFNLVCHSLYGGRGDFHMTSWSDFHRKEAGDLFLYWVGPMTEVVLNHPEAFKEFLNNNDDFQKVAPYNECALSWLGKENILLSNGPVWQRHRRLLNPAFHWENLKTVFAPLEGVVDDTFERFAAFQGAPFNAQTWMNRVTLDALGNCLFSYDFKATKSDTDDRLYQLYRFMSDTSFSVFGVLSNYLLRLPTRFNAEFRAKASEYCGILDAIIRTRRQEAREAKVGGVEVGKRDLLAMMLEESSEGELTSAEILNNTSVFFLAGHDTTSTALSVAIYFLAMHPDKQQTLREEALQVLGEKDRFDYDDMKQLKYTSLFIKECLRMYPPARGLVPRVATRDVTIMGKYHIKKGATVNINLGGVQRDPRFWEDPDKFWPERFLPQNSKGRHPFAYLPFSLGPRNCIGLSFSLLEQRLFLAKLVLRFDVTPALPGSDLLWTRGMLSHPTNVLVKMTERTRAM